jgi:predicted nucleic acid-binding protein
VVKFWDTSAVVPLCVAEPASLAVRRLVDADPSLVVWWATRVESRSALARRRRDGTLTVAGAQAARRNIESLAAAWSEVLPSEPLRQRAERLLAVHALRAADAFQLAAALLWSRGDTLHHAIVSFDDRLREAASREGFRVEPQ